MSALHRADRDRHRTVPAIILLVIVRGVLAGLPVLLIGGLANLIFGGTVPWLLAGVVGVPILILVVVAPWIFLDGLMEVFKSSVWMLGYRELRALEPAKLTRFGCIRLGIAPVT